MNIVELIENNRPNFNTDFFEHVIFRNHDSQNETLKGSLGEGYVRYWLLGIAGIDIFDINLNNDFYSEDIGFRKSQNGGIIIRNKSTRIEQEYDEIFEHESKVYTVEVKSGKLNGVEAKLTDKVNMSKDVYGSDFGGLLLFFPIFFNSQQQKIRIQENNPDVRCIDLGYKKKQMIEMCDKYRQWISRNR